VAHLTQPTWAQAHGVARRTEEIELNRAADAPKFVATTSPAVRDSDGREFELPIDRIGDTSRCTLPPPGHTGPYHGGSTRLSLGKESGQADEWK